MVLTRAQEQAVKIAVERYEHGEKYTVISGHAGSGKSTVVRFIIDALSSKGIKETDVCFCAYTGKACQVLQNKGNKNVLTTHKLLYDFKPKPTGGFYRFPKKFLPYKVIIIDEVSMFPKDLMDLLLSHNNIYVIFLGDDYQLPPIDKKQDNHLLESPHIVFTEILRQAQESDIIRFTMKIRNGEKLPISYQSNEVQVYPKSELNMGMLHWADQILVATNANRKKINATMRQDLGKTGKLADGDKIICCRNYWDDASMNGDALVNGTIGYVHSPFESFVRFPSYLYAEQDLPIFIGNFVSETGEDYASITMDKKFMVGGENALDWKTAYRIAANLNYKDLLPKEFTYAYAITVHRAQGSEWDNVLVMEEAFPFGEEHSRWLYTAATRAREKLVIVR